MIQYLLQDEGFYQLANEIQLLRPEKFNNIFLDMENTMICYLEIYLEVSGIKDVLDDKNILALIL